MQQIIDFLKRNKISAISVSISLLIVILVCIILSVVFVFYNKLLHRYKEKTKALEIEEAANTSHIEKELRFDLERDRCKDAIEKTVSDHNIKIQEAQKLIKKLELSLQLQQNKLCEYEKEINRLKTEQDESDDERFKRFEEIANLNTQHKLDLEGCDATIKILEDDSQSLKRTIEQLERAHASQNEKIKNLRAELEEKDDEIFRKSVEKDQLEDRHKSEIKIYETETKNLNNQIQSLETTISDLKKILNSQEQKIKNLEEERALLKSTQAENLERVFEEKNNLQKELSEKTAETKSLKKNIANQKTQIKEKDSSYKELEGKYQEAEEINDKLRKGVDEAIERHKKLKTENKFLKKALQEKAAAPRSFPDLIDLDIHSFMDKNNTGNFQECTVSA